MRRIVLLLVVPLIVLALLGRLRTPGSSRASTTEPSAPSGQSTSPAAPAAVAPMPASTRAGDADVGFRSSDRLHEHFAKHGAEFGRVSEAEYLALAQQLRDAPAGGEILEIVRGTDGVVSRFDRASGAFGAFDRDRTIRTFFKPNDGEAYFRRQAKRRPQP